MEALAQYIRAYGPSKFAAAIGVSRGCVSHWISGRRKPNREHWPKIEQVTGLGRRAIRPDLFE